MRARQSQTVIRAKAGAMLCSRQFDQRIAELTAAVQLQRDIELSVATLREELQQLFERSLVLGEARKTRKYQEVVDVVVKTSDEVARPGEPDQRDACVRKERAERSKRRNGAEQVAKL